MRLGGRQGSSNVEDRRGTRVGGVGLPLGGGIGGIVLILAISFLTGTNPLDLLGGLTSAPVEDTGTAPPADDPQAKFVSQILGSTEEAWRQIFTNASEAYVPPVLVLFDGATRSACGLGESAMGPFYCPADQKVYLDLSFFRDLDQRFGAPGDFAQAYVVAHEVGHHVQTLLGEPNRIRAAREHADATQANELSVRTELQADCFAGIWGAYAAQNGLLEPGDVEEGLNAAAAIGDDRLQKQTTGRVVPESFTHGSSADRVKWFRRGLESGRIPACDTFQGI